MTETPFYFPNGQRSLFGIFHAPGTSIAQSAFVFCHPFGEEKLWTHRVFVSFARQLAADGHPVLRFDYAGNGDSDGSFSETSVRTAIADVDAAVAHMRSVRGVTQVNLLGLRFGATVAALAAEELPEIDRLILWAPIVDGSRYMQELLRINLTTQMATYKEIRDDRDALAAALHQGQTVNVDGYELGLPLFSEISAVKLSIGRKCHRGPCLVTQIDRQEGRPAPDLQQLVDSYPGGTLTFAQEEPFWKEIARFYDRAPSLFSVTSAWLREGTR